MLLGTVLYILYQLCTWISSKIFDSNNDDPLAKHADSKLNYGLLYGYVLYTKFVLSYTL